MSQPAVRVWFFVLREAPTAVVDVTVDGDTGGLAGMLRFTLEAAGLREVPAFYGHALEPQPPSIAWHLDDELTLADENGERILRLDARGVDAAWKERAVAVKGSATYVTSGLPVDATAGAREVCEALDQRAREGQVVAGIVGVGSSAPSLPLFG